ncbi:30S ribosomal protein S12 methylthiotransferase RimO [Proteiniborus sp. MB09-C3]|uniref:30S ribosomal protein S12 methylthiotransferase RimO n=1 Tax=Proteiniborus sp. MB09-C3 TaxID=3050072 RepID=UPI0025522FDA|nr:30S ribosomal protein S12 methylthiotransferase RimO [Proteiniborus sp. MB09-C3]WIV11495.1 30S ribosomal protein S12 methylthiotransferase RimO [Proteiniborus sp. MB09-C3]
MNVGFISLGCSKNLVVTEGIIGLFNSHNFNIVNDAQEADIIVINTCGFIESAKQEAINTIFEMAELKKNRCKYLIVTGCLVQRYKDELEREIPEVDLFLSISDYDRIWKEIENLLDLEEDKHAILDFNNRVLTTGENMAYLKIAEGCNNNCTYCAIPYIQGPYISRPMEDILKEAKNLADQGIKELVVIAQDTTKYGIDLYGESKLAQLLEELCKIGGFQWIRFLYAYPESITDELINVVKNNHKICSYFDIPIQHISDSVLKRMNRKSDGASIRGLIDKIREEIPDVILRTTLIVGFPGETEQDFNELYEFVKETKFDKLGVFTYSKEDNTPAAKLEEQVHHSIKKSRFNKIMKLQEQISKDKLNEKIGNVYQVLIESLTSDNEYYVGRTYMDVPDMDGVVFVKNNGEGNLINKFVYCKIREAIEYDLIAEIEN